MSTPTGVKAKGTSKEKAEAQARLLNAIDHGFKPTKKRKHGSCEFGKFMEKRMGM